MSSSQAVCVMRRSHVMGVLCAVPACVLLVVCFMGPVGTPWMRGEGSGNPQLLLAAETYAPDIDKALPIARSSYRDKKPKINRKVHYQYPYLVNWPSLQDLLEDDYTVCHKTALFVGPFDYIKDLKNPCWKSKGVGGQVLKCLPYFYLAGFSKSGTSDLAWRLKNHPQMHFTYKEQHWFDTMRYTHEFNAFSDYTDMFREFTKKMEDDEDNSLSNMVTGDMTPNYSFGSMYWRCFEGNEGLPEPKYVIPDVIHHMNPKAKVVILMRDPVRRLFSRYLTWVGRLPTDPAYMKPSAQMFHDKCKDAIQAYRDCFEKNSVRYCAYDGNLYGRVRLRLQESMYSVFIKDWLRVFPRKQILFLRFEDYIKDIPRSLTRVFKFLDLDPLPMKNIEVIAGLQIRNPGVHYDQVKDMLNSTKEMLKDFYRPYVHDLQNLIGEEFCWDDLGCNQR